MKDITVEQIGEAEAACKAELKCVSSGVKSFQDRYPVIFQYLIGSAKRIVSINDTVPLEIFLQIYLAGAMTTVDLLEISNPPSCMAGLTIGESEGN